MKKLKTIAMVIIIGVSLMPVLNVQAAEAQIHTKSVEFHDASALECVSVEDMKEPYNKYKSEQPEKVIEDSKYFKPIAFILMNILLIGTLKRYLKTQDT